MSICHNSCHNNCCVNKVDCLRFYFDINDVNFVTKTIILDDTSGNYISQEFVKCPIYKEYNCGNVKQIGYNIENVYVQQADTNKYLVRINSTYYIDNYGTISWQYSFMNIVPESYYPLNTVAASNIICTTDKYLGKRGYVNLTATDDGIRRVKVIFK
jgi:hypothetical protein